MDERYKVVGLMIRYLRAISGLLLWCGFLWVRIQSADWRCGVVAPTAATLQEWARQRARPAAIPATGSPRLLMVRVDFSDLEGSPLDEATAAAMVVGADQMFADMSVGRLRLVPVQAGGSAITPVLRLPLPSSIYGIAGVGRLRDDALAAAMASGLDPASFDLDVICFGPATGPAFNFSGFATVGSRGVWLRDSFVEPGNLVHELGHNFGLNHANGWDTAGGPPTGPGQELEYADVADSMGRSPGMTRHFNAQKKAQLGWLAPEELHRVTASGVYRLYACDVTNAAPGPRAIVLGRNDSTNYWLELRQRFVSVPGWTDSLAIRWAEDSARPTLLLDTTPGSRGDFRDAPLLPGWTFSDRAAGLHFRNRGFHPPAAGLPAALDVEIQVGQFPDNHPPTANLAPVTAVSAPNIPLMFSVSAADLDGDFLSYAWDFGDGSFGSDSANVVKAFPVDGDYLIRCMVSDGRGGIAVVQTVVSVGSVGTGRLQGYIRDPDGRGVGGLWVSLGANRSTVTDTEGRYVFIDVANGVYRVRPLVESGLCDPVDRALDLSGVGTVSVADFTFFEVATLQTVTLVPAGADWRYLDDGSNAGTAWLSGDFADEFWSHGPAPLGYGYPDLGSLVRFGPNPLGRWITTYFRRKFVLEHSTDYLGARLRVQADDAAVVYLNGNEVWRQNLPDGPVNFLTLPRSEISAADARRFSEAILSSPGWLTGTNVVSVEVHQWRPTDIDLRLDLQLQGLTRGGVIVPAQLVAQPVPLTLAPGQSGNLRVEAIGTEPLQFQWFRNGVALPGGTHALLSFPAVQSDDLGEYTCQVSNAGGSTLSREVSLTLLSGPVLVSQPADQRVTEGSDVTFTVSAMGSAPLLYQWLKDTVPIAGAGDSTLTLSAISAAAAAKYQVIVRNALGTVTSIPAGLTVVLRPRITQAPANLSVLAGAPFSLAVTATGTLPLVYEWRLSGALIPGGTNAILNVGGLAALPAFAEFQVKISNAAGSVVSATVTVTVNSGPAITASPANLKVVLGAPADFEVHAEGTGPLTYQWRHDGNLVPTAIGPRLSIPVTQMADAGRYQVVVGGAAGFLTNEASLNFWVAPNPVVSPVALARLVGQSGQLEAGGVGDPSPSWQWFKNGQIITGATNAVLRFEALQLTDTGSYTVFVRNAVSSAESSPARLDVLPTVLPATFTDVLIEGTGIRWRLRGTPGQVYRVESSVDLGDWRAETSIQTGPDGVAELRMETLVDGGPVRGHFFRALTP